MRSPLLGGRDAPRAARRPAGRLGFADAGQHAGISPHERHAPAARGHGAPARAVAGAGGNDALARPLPLLCDDDGAVGRPRRRLVQRWRRGLRLPGPQRPAPAALRPHRRGPAHPLLRGRRALRGKRAHRAPLAAHLRRHPRGGCASTGELLENGAVKARFAARRPYGEWTRGILRLQGRPRPRRPRRPAGRGGARAPVRGLWLRARGYRRYDPAHGGKRRGADRLHGRGRALWRRSPTRIRRCLPTSSSASPR